MLIRLLGDVLSPPRCAACDAAVTRDHVFCSACAASVERCDCEGLTNARAADRATAAVEESIEADSSVDVAFGYYGGALATAIRRLKYEDRPYLARALGDLLRRACRDAAIEADVVVPVPLHPRRLVERGYNQSALLAAHVARELRASLVTTALARTADTLPQASLSAAERRTNLATAIGAHSAAPIAGRVVALVDDVTTTGATLRACREALMGAGARAVLRVVIARSFPGAGAIPLRLDAGTALDIGVNRACASSGCANVPLRANLRN